MCHCVCFSDLVSTKDVLYSVGCHAVLLVVPGFTVSSVAVNLVVGSRVGGSRHSFLRHVGFLHHEIMPANVLQGNTQVRHHCRKQQR